MKKVDARHMLMRTIARRPLEISYDVGVSGDGKFISSSYAVNLRVVDSCLRAGWLARAEVLHRFRESPRLTYRHTITALGRHTLGMLPPARIARKAAPKRGRPRSARAFAVEAKFLLP